MARPNQPNSKEFKRVLAYFETFSTESGQAVLRDLLKSFYDVPSYVRGDTYEAAFREGNRGVIFYILSMLKQSKHPEAFERTPDEINEEGE